MGCCLSSPPSSKLKPKTHISKSKTTTTSKSPPPTQFLLEEPEETVKEVLSETPRIPRSFQQNHRKNHSPFIKSAPLLHQNAAVPQKKTSHNDDVLEEVCSTLSESVSASTNEFHEIRQRSPAKKREKTVGRSPGRRSEPSPGRARPGGSGPGLSRRKESGDNSGRRSKSPVTRGDSKPNLGRTQSARKTGKSPARVGSGLGDRIRKVPPPTSNESIENPLVSLECFIFL